MMIEPHENDKDALRELKVKVPITQHIRLHALKIRNGQQISETVQVALREYFARRTEPRAGAPPSDSSRSRLEP